MPELSTTILRFRDLVTERGITIQSHQQIADTTGHVWWGWWNKFGEKVPTNTFLELKNRARQGAFDIYLLDSGQLLFFKATCLDIEWEITLENRPSPESGATPDYYKEQLYPAWFKLKDFTLVESPESILHTFSYFQVDELFAGGSSPYEIFYNKRVHSLQELRQQERTIWFVRAFLESDKTHEISLLSNKSLNPEHFSSSYFETPSRQLLWVSDLHFSTDGHYRFPQTSDGQRFPLGHQIERALGDTIQTSGLGGLIVSGDISWKAAPEEFEMAKGFIKTGFSRKQFEADQIAMCPGNHDLKFSSHPEEKGKKITITTEEARNAYNKFYQDIFFLAPNKFLSCGRRFLLGKAIPVDVVCLNSSLLQQIPGFFQGHGFIGQEQMEEAAKEMGWNSPDQPRAVRIVVLHHHLLPVTFSEEAVGNYMYSVVLDAEALARWIVQHRVDLVLHGHMHQPFCAKVTRPVELQGNVLDWHEFSVIGLGSSGVQQSHLGTVSHNTFGLLTFDKTSVTVSIHSVHPVNPSAELWKITLPLKQ